MELLSPAPTEDLIQGRHNLDVFGYTVHPHFLCASRVRALRERLEEQAELERETGVAAYAYDGDEAALDNRHNPNIGSPHGLPRLQRVLFLVNKGRVFIELAQHPLALAYAQSVFNSTPFNVGVQIGVILRKGVPAEPIHIDQRNVPFQTPVPLSINIAVALGDYEQDMGATRFVPGTHTGPAPDREPHIPETIPAVLQPGSALIWDSRVWHGQGASSSEKPRFSIITMYALHFLKTPELYPAVIQDRVYETMSDEERTLYGFRYQGCGFIGPRYPGDRRCNVDAPMPYVPELSRRNGA